MNDRDRPQYDRDRPLYMIGVAAELSGLHPQTLRIYEAKGLVSPKRSQGNTRLYSQADIDRLAMIGQLTSEGINLAGVLRIFDLERRLEEQQQDNARLRRLLKKLEQRVHEYEMRDRITALAKPTAQAIRVVVVEGKGDKGDAGAGAGAGAEVAADTGAGAAADAGAENPDAAPPGDIPPTAGAENPDAAPPEGTPPTAGSADPSAAPST